MARPCVSASSSGCATSGRLSRSTHCARRSRPIAAGLACSSIAFHCRIPAVMASHDFFFALEFSSQGAPASLVEDLAANVFRHVGAAPEHAEGLTQALQDATARGAIGGDRRCDIQFRARNGMLEVLVTSNAGRIWQTEILIP